MTRAQEIRKEIVLQLYGGRPHAVSAAFMTRQARKAGYDYRETELVAECAFLEGGRQIEKETDKVSGEVKYRITHDGVLAYENAA